RLQPALAGQPAHDGQREVARGAAGAAGDRDERGPERRQLVDRAPERQLGLDGARRQELEGDDRVAADDLIDPHPPATAGRIVTSSPSFTAVSRPSWKRMSSPFRYTFPNRRRAPLSSEMRVRSSPCSVYRASSASPTVAPSTDAETAPPAASR